MTTRYSRMRHSSFFVSCAVGALIVPWSVAHAGKSIHENVAVDPQGAVEVVDVAGSVELIGWDKPEIEVTGQAADNVDRVDVTTGGMRSTVRVVTRSGMSWGGRDETRLTIHVPSRSAVTAILVSADLKVGNLQGDVKLQTVSGDLSGDVGGDLHVTGVSGSVRLKAPAANRIEVKTISGDIQLSGSGAEADITTISGDAKIDLGMLKRGRFKSVSGDMTVGLALAPDGQIDSESISGTLHFTFASMPGAEFDVQSFSGDIDNCFGPKPMESRYGPGSRLSFKSGEGGGRVRIETKSGDVRFCAKDRHAAQLCPEGPLRPHGASRGGLVMALLERTHFRPVL
jgi:hypothetical protein